MFHPIRGKADKKESGLGWGVAQLINAGKWDEVAERAKQRVNKSLATLLEQPLITNWEQRQAESSESVEKKTES